MQKKEEQNQHPLFLKYYRETKKKSLQILSFFTIITEGNIDVLRNMPVRFIFGCKNGFNKYRSHYYIK